MNDPRDLIKKKFAKKLDQVERWTGVLGDGQGQVAVDGLPNHVYVTVNGQGVVAVYNSRVEPRFGLPVIIGYDPVDPRRLQVLSTQSSVVEASSDYLGVSGPAPASRYRYMDPNGGEDPLWVEMRAFLPNRVGPGGGLSISVYPALVWTGTDWVKVGGSALIDLTSMVPSTAGKARLVLVSVSDSGVIQTTAGTEFNVADIQLSDIPDAPAGTKHVLAAVRLYTGQTEIREARNNSDFADLRFSWRPSVDAELSLSTDANKFLSLSGDVLGLDDQVANTVFAAPNGATGKPEFRALADADIPATIARDSEVTSAISNHAAIPGAHHAAVTLGTANGLSLADQALSMAAADTTNRGAVILTPATGVPDVTSGKAVQASDAPVTPAANRIVRLNSAGDMALPSGGDVLPEGETSTVRGLAAMLAKVGGPRDVIGDYGYNPGQILSPQSWALGQADRCLDDFFRTNTGSPNLSIWSPVTDCEANSTGTPATVQFYASTSIRSWLVTQAKNTASTAPKNHAIYQGTYTETFTSGQFFAARFATSFQGATKRIGFVIMNSDLLNGAAFWLENNSSNYSTLYCATYNHATEPWLSHANAKSSNVAYTTNWTTRYTSQNIYPEWMRPQMVAMRPSYGTDMTTGNSIQFWGYDATGLFRNRLAYVSLPYRITPYYIYMFTEGNVDSLSLTSFWDFIGRGALA